MPPLDLINTPDSSQQECAVPGGSNPAWLGIRSDPTTVVQERGGFPSECSFRVLRWKHDLDEVSLVVSPEDHRLICGEGAHWHYHRFLEITLFEEGRGTRFVGDRIDSFASGDIVLLGENLPHYWKTSGPSSGLSVQWYFPSTHPFWGLAEAGEIAAHFASAVRGILYKGTSARQLTVLLRRLSQAKGLKRLGLFIQLLSETVEAPAECHEFLATRAFCLTENSMHKNRIREAIRYILTHFREHIGMNDILRITHLTKPTFCREFKRHTRKSLTGFIQEIRLQSACRELSTTRIPIIDVAYNSGFSQVSFFNRVFLRTFGRSPSDYRRMHLMDSTVA